MRFNRLDLNLLVAFGALLQDRNVSRAAKRLNMSQSALSDALGRLRDFFGDDLFVPMGRQMSLTPLASSMADQVQGLLVQANVLISTQPKFVPAEIDRMVRIMASDYVITTLLIDFVRHVRTISPKVRFDFQPPTLKSPGFVERGEVDFLVTPDAVADPDQPSCRLFKDEYVGCVWSKARMVKRNLTPSQYLSMGHAVTRLGLGGADTFDRFVLERTPHKRREEVIVPNFHTLPLALEGTDLIATIPRRLAQYYAQLFPIKIVRLPLKIPPLVEMLQWNALYERDPALMWLRDLIVSFSSSPRARS